MKQYEKINIIWSSVNIFSIFLVCVIINFSIGEYSEVLNILSFVIFLITAVLIIGQKGNEWFPRINVVIQSIGLLFSIISMIAFGDFNSFWYKAIIYILNIFLGFKLEAKYEKTYSKTKGKNYYLIAILCAVLASAVGYLIIYIQNFYLYAEPYY